MARAFQEPAEEEASAIKPDHVKRRAGCQTHCVSSLAEGIRVPSRTRLPPSQWNRIPASVTSTHSSFDVELAGQAVFS